MAQAYKSTNYSYSKKRTYLWSRGWHALEKDIFEPL
jgi:hypothetical protein